MIRVGIPAFGTDHGRSGIGSYLRELLVRFDADQLIDRFSFEFIGPGKDRDVFLAGTKNIGWLQIEDADPSPMRNFVWNQLKFPSICRQRRYDLVFFPAANRRLSGKLPCPSVGTVHDLATLHIKNKYDFSHAVFNRHLLPMLVRSLDHVLTVSEFSKNDIIRFASVDSNRITVTHLAADMQRFNTKSDPKIGQKHLKDKFDLDAPYILYISRLEHPGKNHVNLIHAFTRFRQLHPDRHLLVLPGPDKERAQEIHAAAEASPYANDIRFLGFIDASDVPILYRGARLFVLPSFFEGFGLPVLEAMACGTPVVTSHAASLPEVSGPHTPHFDPHDSVAMCDAMASVLSDENHRQQLVKESLAWVSQFSWERTVNETLAAFESTVAQSRRKR